MSTVPLRPLRAPVRRARRRRARLALLAVPLALGATFAPTPPPAGAATSSFTATGRISLTSTGQEVVQSVGGVVAISGNGRYVAFTSGSALTPGDTSGNYDLYVRDRLGGDTELVSLTDDGVVTDGSDFVCGLSRDGRYVGFVAGGEDLPAEDDQIYVRDRLEGTTELASVSSTEVPSGASDFNSGIDTSAPCPLSDDGRYLAFESEDGTLAAGATDTDSVYRRDLFAGTTIRVSIAASGTPDGNSRDVAMSADGNVVAFTSDATNMVQGDTNQDDDVFVRTISNGTTQRVSVTAGGGQVEESSYDPSITADGKKVAFTSTSETLAAGDTNGYDDVYVRDRQANTVVRASVGADGQLGSGGRDGEISDDGRFVSFNYYTPAVIPGDANGLTDVLRRDLQAGTTAYVSRTPSGVAGNNRSDGHDTSGDGTAVAFTSRASDLVRNDTNGWDDVFVRDFRVETSPFANRAAFVRQQYLDFFGRPPTNAEKAMWEGRFTNGEVVPEQMVDAMAHSSTWAGRRAPVIRLYWAFFLRVPDTAGLEYWIAKSKGGMSLATMATKFAGSQEFTTKYGALGSAGFVTKVYENVLSRSPDAGGLAYWKGQLDGGKKTRGDVMVGFSESAEGRRHMAPATDSVLVWLGMLRTVPDGSWSLGVIGDAYAGGEPPEIVPHAILGRADYADRVS